ncbi:hypothetical protein T05_3709, partial [Trichinella murrelli]
RNNTDPVGVTRPRGGTRKSRVGKNNTRAPPARSLSEHLAAPSRGQKGLLLRPDLSAFARQLRARLVIMTGSLEDPNHDHLIGCRRGCRLAPEIASAPAASELPIGGSRRVDRGPADLGPIYMARKRAAKYIHTYTYPDLYQFVYLSIRVCVSVVRQSYKKTSWLRAVWLGIRGFAVLVVSIAGIQKSRVGKCGRTESKCNGRTIERGTRTYLRGRHS